MKLVKKIQKLWKPLVDAQPDFAGCKMFTGEENFDEICELLLSTQGLEFCIKNSFPSLELFEGFLEDYDPKEKGIYINCGTIELENEPIVLLVGNTSATLKYNNLTSGFQVIVMHNASAEIIADNYAVVFTHGQTENIVVEASNNAIVK